MTTYDAGLGAVARVRGVREQDSRIGLQLALAEAASRRERLGTLRSRMAAEPLPETTTPAALLGSRTALAFLGDAVRTAEREAEAARELGAEARRRWEHDRTRLAAVERLLRVRAERRRVDTARRQAKEADDLAAQRWLRGMTTPHAPRKRSTA